MHQSEALLSIVTDLTSTVTAQDRYHRLLQVIRDIVGSDAATLLRKEGDTLRLLAAESIDSSTLLPTYRVREHPRLQIICDSRQPVLFPSDSPLPDPFDEHLELHSQDGGRIHSCLGCPLWVEDELVGVLTADSLKPDAFTSLDFDLLSMLGGLAGAALRTSELVSALERTAEQQGLVARDLMRSVHETAGPFLLGTSPLMEKLREEIDFAARCDLPVLITGETGTGKELVARSIQARSSRKDQAIIYVNCAAIPDNLVESELFGHVRGAFTGAEQNRAGKFEIANGGTLFLDEIGELPLTAQAKLLRTLQEGEIQRIGSDQTRKVDVRIITATNRDLAREVAEGRFRADLFYRLNGYPIHVPPLREHPEDIPTLASYFCDTNQQRLDASGIQLSASALRVLRAYSWPGNVRELRNIMDRVTLKSHFRRPGFGILRIEADDLPSDIREENSRSLNSNPDHRKAASAESDSSSSLLLSGNLRERTEAFQREQIQAVVRKNGGNWAQAARELGLHRSNLSTLAKRLGLR